MGRVFLAEELEEGGQRGAAARGAVGRLLDGAVCDAAAWSVKETLDMVAAADSYADLHAGTPRDKLREHMDCYLESCYPDAEDELREQIVTRACR